MGRARYVGRLGALTVAMGLGFAVATTPGIACAAPSDSISEPQPTGGAPAAASPPANTAPTVSSPSTESTDPTPAAEGDGTEGDGTDGDGTFRPTEGAPSLDSAGSSSTTVVVNDDGPIVTVSSSGGAHTSTDTKDADLDPAPVLKSVKHATTAPLDALTPSVGVPTRAAAADDPNPPATTVTTARSIRPDVQRVAALSPAAPPTAVIPGPPPGLDEILEEPHTFLVTAVAHLAGAVLNVFLAPFGPGSPLQSPMIWTILAYVRDEFERILVPHAAPGNVSSSLAQSPNLLVNPGAEAGDPSLSGYAAVSVPGWVLTGTPTVIEYGTQRRFPVPTPTPGPVLPSFLAFPRSDGPIPTPAEGVQFFGGGPVADSSLTQRVDLVAASTLIDAGDGVFNLGGDLGGFFIDPSRTYVSVDFLDTNGVVLGTGALRSVTAWDRLFTTGFIHRQTTGAIPVGTRSARVVVAFDDRNPVLGNYNNAYADNLSFTVNDTGLTPAPLAPPVSHVGQLDHVFMVYLENKGVGQIVGSPNAPYLNLLLESYGYASNYYGVTHPSDPNYYPIIGGSDFGFNYNCPSSCFPAGTPNLADSIEAAGLQWAGYAEGGGGYTSPTDRLPFLAFSDIYDDPQRVATHLFDISALEHGLADPNTAPNFVWFAADDETNMEGPTDFPFGILNWVLGFLNPSHQYNVKAGDDWLKGPLTTIFNSPTWQAPGERSVVFVTFDEDYNNITTGVGNEGNHIVTIGIPSPGAVAGGMRPGGFVAVDHYNHYSLQRTIELALGLAPLTNNDRYAQPMNEFWV